VYTAERDGVEQHIAAITWSIALALWHGDWVPWRRSHPLQAATFLLVTETIFDLPQITGLRVPDGMAPTTRKTLAKSACAI